MFSPALGSLGVAWALVLLLLLLLLLLFVNELATRQGPANRRPLVTGRGGNELVLS